MEIIPVIAILACIVAIAFMIFMAGYEIAKGQPIKAYLPRNRYFMVVGRFTSRYGGHYALLDEGEKSFRLYQLSNSLPDDALIIETDSNGKLGVTARTTDQPPPPPHIDQRA